MNVTKWDLSVIYLTELYISNDAFYTCPAHFLPV